MRTREGSNQDARLYPLHRNYWMSDRIDSRAEQWIRVVLIFENSIFVALTP